MYNNISKMKENSKKPVKSPTNIPFIKRPIITVMNVFINLEIINKTALITTKILVRINPFFLLDRENSKSISIFYIMK
jgi:hypothetical protein